MSEAKVFDPERIIRVLAEHQVEYVLIGALAARMQGFPRLTADADIVPAEGAITDAGARSIRAGV